MVTPDAYAKQRDILQVEVRDKLHHPIDVALVGVVRTLGGLIRPSEANEIRRENAMPGSLQQRDHLAI